jgi:hypothetical protein
MLPIMMAHALQRALLLPNPMALIQAAVLRLQSETSRI